MPRSSSSRKGSKADATAEASAADQQPGVDPAAELSYSEAQTALELALHQLQDSSLDVESMAELYQRARRYAARCEAVLSQVEQRVALWDPETPDAQPQRYEP